MLNVDNRLILYNENNVIHKITGNKKILIS